MSYYKQVQMIAQVDKIGKTLGEVEKWEAHKKGILHKAFTIALQYQGKCILQQRKHLAFDGMYDLTSSSHQLFENGKLQPTLEAIYNTLKREWGLKKEDLSEIPQKNGEVYYQAKDPNSEFTEHELCEIWLVKLKKLPTPNFEYAYGYILVSEKELKKPFIWNNLAPWVQAHFTLQVK